MQLTPRQTAEALVIAMTRVHQARLLEFDESKHPRDEKGQFSETGESAKVTGSGASSVRERLNKMPEGMRRDIGAQTIEAYGSATEANERINEYLMEHYGMTTEQTMRALTDRQNKTIITTTDQKTLNEQVAHALVHRRESEDFKKAVGGGNLEKEWNTFVSSVMDASSVADVPAQLQKVVVPAYQKLMKKWGWS